MIFKAKLKRVLFPVFLLLTLFLYLQGEKVNGVTYKGQTYDLYPVMLKKCPAVPSPYTTAEGKEFVIGITKNNDYVLLPVTVENGEPYVYTKSGKGKQLEVDGKDFPNLARTGLHSKLELDQAKTITGVSISQITYNGRPNRASGAGFMAEDEDIISVLKGDNRLVKKLGLTHPRVAKPLFHIWNAILEQFTAYKKGRPWCEVKTILYNGKKISIEVGRTKGWQESIFNDEIYGGCHIYIRRELEKEEKRFLERHYSRLNEKQMEELIKKLSFIHTGEMEPYYIQRYGFYEGHTDYRTDPVAISFIFGLRSIEEIEAAFKGKLYEVLTEHFTKGGWHPQPMRGPEVWFPTGKKKKFVFSANFHKVLEKEIVINRDIRLIISWCGCCSRRFYSAVV